MRQQDLTRAVFITRSIRPCEILGTAYLIFFSLLAFLSNLDIASASDPKAAEKPAETPIGTQPTDQPTFEYTCNAEVSYTWKFTPEPGKRIAVQPEPKKVFFRIVQATDSTEELSHSKIATSITKTKQDAYSECQQLHESNSLCLATRLQALSDRYDQADFQTRKLLLDSSKKDCESQFGECISTAASEITCTKVEKKQEQKSPTAAPEKAAESDKKGAKKK